MDTGRFILQQPGWDTSSGLESYDSHFDQDPRRGVFGGRRLIDQGFQRDNVFPRAGYPRDQVFERDPYAIGAPVLSGSLWPQTKRGLEVGIRHGNEKLVYVDNRQDYHYDQAHGCADWESEEREEYSWSRDVENETSRHHDQDFDRERGRSRDWRRRDRERGRRSRSKSRSRSRSRSRNQDWSPEKDWRRDHSHERSHSYGHDDHGHRSRSPRPRGKGRRDDRHVEHDDRNEKKRSREGSWQSDIPVVVPSATLVVKGLSQKTVEDDLYQALSEWGPLKHVRVIKEKNSGASRGFAFIDFPSVEAAQKMMEVIGYDGVIVNGRRLFFEYSSKPTGGPGAPPSLKRNATRSSAGTKSNAVDDWTCTMCGCANFARRIQCFQCNEGRSDDAPPADVSASAFLNSGKRGSEAAPTHVLVVRGLDENVDEESLHYEFSKYAPIKDLRLVRDKHTHVSRGFAFVHFSSVDDATKALDATNGKALDKNGHVLKVAYAKSIHGPGASTGAAASAASSLAAAAIEAAAFSQQYGSVGWVPKEYSEQENNADNRPQIEAGHQGYTDENSKTQSGFVWDEASGYYYDAASGFYYDGVRGLYYDGNSGIWYTYNETAQQYEVCADGAPNTGPAITSNNNNKAVKIAGDTKVSQKEYKKAAVISAPACTIKTDADIATSNRKFGLGESAATGAAAVTLGVSKRDKDRAKEKDKEIRLAGKNPVMGSKKKMGNVVNLWKQRQHETSAPSAVPDNTSSTATSSTASLSQPNSGHTENASLLSGIAITPYGASSTIRFDSPENVEDTEPRATTSVGHGGTNPFGGNYRPPGGIIRSKNYSIPGAPSYTTTIAPVERRNEKVNKLMEVEDRFPSSDYLERAGRGGAFVERGGDGTDQSGVSNTVTSFRTDASALGSYGGQTRSKRRFTETPQAVYRDRAAERRNLHGSSLPGD